MYRLHTEKTDQTWAAIVSSPIVQSGCTIMEGVGYWKGKPERSVIVEVTDEQEGEIRSLARRIVKRCGQEAVLLVHLANRAEFIRG